MVIWDLEIPGGSPSMQLIDEGEERELSLCQVGRGVLRRKSTELVELDKAD